MAILAVGTDIVEIARFRSGRLSERFLRAVFTDAERSYCQGAAKPEQHLAVRFAAKEAAAKALSSVAEFVSVCQIEVVRGDKGVPRIVLLQGRHGEPAPATPDGAKLHVSLSHSDHYAVATVILEAA
jgi:holo-[acyl-carrier protein] synthase